MASRRTDKPKRQLLLVNERLVLSRPLLDAEVVDLVASPLRVLRIVRRRGFAESFERAMDGAMFQARQSSGRVNTGSAADWEMMIEQFDCVGKSSFD